MQLPGQHPGVAGRQGHGGAARQGGDEDEEGAAEHRLVPAGVEEGRDRGHAGRQARPRVHHGPRPGGGPGGEHDHRVGVVVHGGARGHAEPGRPQVQRGRAPRQPRPDRGHRPQARQVGQREPGPPGQRPGPARHRLGGRVGEHQRRPGQRETGPQHVGPGARVQDGSAQPEPPQREQDGEGPRPGAHGDPDGVPGAQPARVQGRGERVRQLGEFAAGGPHPGRAGAGGGEYGGPLGAAAQGVVESVQHQRGSSVPCGPLPWSRYQRAVPAIP